MCGRINLRVSPKELAEMFALFREPEWVPRYNISPMQRSLVIRVNHDGVRLAEPLQWGLVPEHAQTDRDYWHIARSETVATMPPFNSVYGRQHCLILADGFYEWQKFNRRESQPWHIFGKNGLPLVMAGIWDHWIAPSGEMLESFAMLTTTPNEFMAEIHDRQPVILGRDAWEVWLTTTTNNEPHLKALLAPCPSDWLDRTAVGRFVNKVGQDSPECIRPVKAMKMLF